MVSQVYIGIMMTRILLAMILSVKMVKNHEKPQGENISVFLDSQNSHNFHQNQAILMGFFGHSGQFICLESFYDDQKSLHALSDG